jgi:hypothetical protein
VILADAARLLAHARSADALAPLARAAGVHGAPHALPRGARDALAAAIGPGAALPHARVAIGPAPLHALLADVEGAPLRDAAARLAAHLGTAAPHALWLLALRHTADGSCALAAWHAGRQAGRGPGRAAPRVAALRWHPDAVAPSDADTAAHPRRPRRGRDHAAPRHATWLDVLGRDALGARFYRTLERTVGALADSLPPSVARPDARADLALLTATRLLFLAFLEAKGWLDGDRAFLTRHYDAAMERGGRFHARTLRPLFFGTLNTPRRHRAPAAHAFGRVPFLNGGLFAPTPLERRHPSAHCGDAALGALVHTVLAAHRFTAHEHAAAWSEAAVDPEMLGRAFESLMSARERHTTGAFYTPRPLVEHATTEALRHALATPDPPAGAAPDRDAPDLAGIDRALAGEPPPPPVARRLHARVSTLRVLDPACGSGAFLVHALERLADLLATCGDPRLCGRPPPGGAHPLDLRRRRQPHGGLAVRAPPLALGRGRARCPRPARRPAPPQPRPQRARGRRARRPAGPRASHPSRVGRRPVGRSRGHHRGARRQAPAALAVAPAARRPPRAVRHARRPPQGRRRAPPRRRRTRPRARGPRRGRRPPPPRPRRRAHGRARPDLFGHRHRPSVDARARLAALRAAVRLWRPAAAPSPPAAPSPSASPGTSPTPRRTAASTS